MKTLEYRTIDKSTWMQGEWLHEPDKLQYLDEVTGLPCLIIRNCYSGHLCGYVGVLESHPWFGREYDEMDSIEVHGGLTFSDRCSPNETPEQGICYIVEPGESAVVWWLGFDCAHSCDLSPAHSSRYNNGTYRNIDYVKQQCELLALQLSKVTQ